MAKEAKDKQGNNLRFIRKNGKVIPIRAKGPGGKSRTIGVKAKSGKKTGTYTVASKNISIFHTKGAFGRVKKSSQEGERKGAKVGSALGALGAGAAVALSKRGPGVSKLSGFLGAAIAATGGALGGAMIGSGVGRARGKRKGLTKEMRSGNIEVYRRKKKGNTGF